MLLPLLGQYCRTKASTQNVSQKEKEKKSLFQQHIRVLIHKLLHDKLFALLHCSMQKVICPQARLFHRVERWQFGV